NIAALSLARGARSTAARLEAETRPQRALLHRRQHTGRPVLRRRESGARQRHAFGGPAAPEAQAAQEPFRPLDAAQAHLLAEAVAQHTAQLTQGVGKTELDCLGAGPELAAEQLVLRRLQALAAAVAHHLFEDLVEIILQRLDARHVVRILRAEGIENRLALAGGVDAPLDAELFHQPREAKALGDDADRADDRGRLDKDL